MRWIRFGWWGLALPCLLVGQGVLQAGGEVVPFCEVLPPATGVAGVDLDDAPVPTVGEQRLLYIRVRFPRDTGDPATGVEVDADLTAADAILRRTSHGRWGLSWTVTPVLALGAEASSYEGPGGFDRFIDDAREAAQAAGFDYRDHDLEVVRHSGVPGFAGGNARLGRRGAQVQVGGPVLLAHELGHNLGLPHANFWDTSGPGISAASPPLPSHFASLPDPRSVPVHPESAVGHDTVTGPGASLEYGDPWDIMGGGDAGFGAAFLQALEWLPPSAFLEVGSGRTDFRLHAPDEGDPATDGRLRAARLRGIRGPDGTDRVLTVEIPGRNHGEIPPPGVLLRWVADGPEPGASLLLDASPGSPGVNADALLEPGRTFTDRVSEVFITIIGWGTEGDQRWADVVVRRGPVALNAPPVLSWDDRELQLQPGEVVTLEALAADPDGDDVVIGWDRGDGSPVEIGTRLTAAWKSPGDYVVRAEATDLRGGQTLAHRVVRVGEATTGRVQGVVRDPAGRPLPGVRVHNGVTRGDGRGQTPITTWTDADGAFSLVGLPAGSYTFGAFHPDHVFTPGLPTEVRDGDRLHLDFIAQAIPEVRVTGVAPVPESAGHVGLFTVTRTGSTDGPLTVLFRLGGTAGPADYARPLVDRLVIPAGAASTTLALTVFEDHLDEPDETLRLTVVPPVSAMRVTEEGHPYTVYHPGYDYQRVGETFFWVRTRPEYATGPGSTAEVVLLDDDAPADQVVTVTAGDGVVVEEPVVEGFFELRRWGATDEELRVRLRISGSALNGTDVEMLPTEVTFGPGETQRRLAVRPVADGQEEPEESIELALEPDPAYGIEGGPARLWIRDRAESPQDLGLNRRADGWLEVTVRGAPGSRLVVEASGDLVSWVPLRTNLLFNVTSATFALPPPAEPRFFRTMRER